MSAMRSAAFQKVTGGLLAVIGLLGVLILGADHLLWQIAPLHAYGLIVFVIVDFGLCVFVFARPSKVGFTLVGVWCLLRIVIQIGERRTRSFIRVDVRSVRRLPIQPVREQSAKRLQGFPEH